MSQVPLPFAGFIGIDWADKKYDVCLHVRGQKKRERSVFEHRPTAIREWAQKLSERAWRAQERLHRRYWLLSNKSKPTGKIVTALARELVGFIWAIGTEVEAQLTIPPRTNPPA